MQDTPRNIHTKFGFNWASSVRGEAFLKQITLKIAKKNVKKEQLLQNGLKDQNENLT